MLSNNYVTVIADYEFGSAEDAVLAFAAQHPELTASAASGVTALLDDYPDEQSRDGELERLGWGYAPRPGQLDQFLKWTRDTLLNRARPETAAG